MSSDGRHRGVGKLVPRRPPERLVASALELPACSRGAQPGGRFAAGMSLERGVMGTNKKSLHKPQSVTQFSPDYGKHAVLLNIFWIYTAPRLG